MTREELLQKAREIAHKAITGTPCGTSLSESAATALSTANLLHDPEEVERGRAALEACVAFAKFAGANAVYFSPEPKDVHAIGLAELERRKPKERWTADGAWLKDTTTATTWTLPSKAHAAAAAKALNAEEAK